MDQALPAAFDFAVPQPISTDIALYGGVFAKRHVIPAAGTYVPQHSHGYDHLSLVTAGAMRIWCDNTLLGDLAAPAEIRIPAHSSHTFMALADGTTFYCVHNEDHFEVEEAHELPGKLRDVGLPKGDGIVFARESIDDFLADESPLFSAHCRSVGEVEDAWKDKNWALMKRLQAQGGLHITTARHDGELLGYLMAIVAPALNEIGAKEAMHTLFFTSPKVPGMGLRLQRASIDFLKSLGVDHVILRAGHRGNGPRLAALYRRLGATHCGNNFMIDLK